MTILYLLLFAVLLINYFFGKKRPQSVLYCGLFGGSFNRPIDNEILNKIKTLGFFNQSRGEHSCGYYNGQDIYKGVDDRKKFVDLVIKDGINLPENPFNNIFIGHVRFATTGTHSADNAHPFLIKDKFILAHNGKIENAWTLCTKYNIPHTTIHVDSKALAELLNQEGYKILEEYKGFAAIMAHDLHKPNILYVYHGASKNYTGGAEVEERPLFYLEQEEGIYISSLDTALNFIKKNKDDKANILPHNKIYAIENGVLKDLNININRGDCNVYKYENYNTKSAVQSSFPYAAKNNTAVETQKVIDDILHKYPNAKLINRAKESPKAVNKSEGLNIQDETMPPEGFGESLITGKIIPWKGRYWIISRKPIELANGSYHINKSGIIIENPHEVLNYTEQKIEQYYFYKGVMLTGVRSFAIINKALNDESDPNIGSMILTQLKKSLTSSTDNFANAISNYTSYPVTNMDDEAVDLKVYRHMWYQNGKLTNNSWTPKFGSRDYIFNDGVLTEIRPKQSTDKVVLKIKVEGFKVGETKTNGYYENVSDIKQYVKPFDMLFYTEKEAYAELKQIQLDALSLYCEDLATDIMRKDDPTEDFVLALRTDLITDAIDQRVPLRRLLVPSLNDIESYIVDALQLNETIEDEESGAVSADADDDIEKKKFY